MATTSRDDGALWERWRGGDALAFEAIVRHHTPRLLASALRLTREGAEAEEVVHEAFIAAWRGAATFDGRSQLGTWLHRIMVNTALGRLRRRSRRREVSMEQAFTPTDDDATVDPPDVRAAETASQNELAGTVWQAIESLHESYRTVLVLRDIEEMSSQEVALALQLSDAAVRQRLHRARQTVAERLRPELCGADAITCGGRLDLLFDHLDGTLDTALREPVAAHVAGCATCTAIALGYEATLVDVRAAAPSLPPSQSERLVRSVVDALRALHP